MLKLISENKYEISMKWVNGETPAGQGIPPAKRIGDTRSKTPLWERRLSANWCGQSLIPPFELLQITQQLDEKVTPNIPPIYKRRTK